MPGKKETSEKPVEKNKPLSKVTGFDPVSAILVTIALYVGAQIIATIVILLYASFKGIEQSEIDSLLINSTFAQFLFYFSFGLFTLLLLWQFLKSRKLKWIDIGLKKPSFENLLLAIPVFGVYFITLTAIVAMITGLVPSINVEQEQQIGFKQATGHIALVLVFVSLVIVPAVTEEILIRGFLYGGLVKKYSKVVAALLASTIFGIAHLQLGSGADPLWIAAIDTFVLSMFLIWLREKTGNIYAGILVHGIKNSLAFVSLFILQLNA